MSLKQREAVGVPRDGLVERSGLHAVQLREVAVEHDLLAANGVDYAQQLSCQETKSREKQRAPIQPRAPLGGVFQEGYGPASFSCALLDVETRLGRRSEGAIGDYYFAGSRRDSVAYHRRPSW